MQKLLLILAVIVALLSLGSLAHAVETPANNYGYTADDIAENQGAVAYWYAWGYKYAFGGFPVTFDAMKTHGLPLRGFKSPHTGDEIYFDDGSLDFDGDMNYAVTGTDVQIRIQTTRGVVVLPGTLTSTDECGIAHCCEIKICKDACWKTCDDNHAAGKILQWMMWKSFETHECRYGSRPLNEQAWIASGFAPLGASWRTQYPYLSIRFISNSCELIKAHVKVCTPCPTCQPCVVAKPCGECDTCKPKCETPCKSKCENKCSPCQPVAKPFDKCNSCKQEPCAAAKPKCDSCDKCRPKCKNKCGQCSTAGLADYSATMDSPPAANPCACDAWAPYFGQETVDSLSISIMTSEGTAGPLMLSLRDPQHRQLALIELRGPIEGNYFFAYTFDSPVPASDLLEAVLINDGTDPATLTMFRVLGLGENDFSHVYIDHTCTGAIVGPGGCTRMEMN